MAPIRTASVTSRWMTATVSKSDEFCIKKREYLYQKRGILQASAAIPPTQPALLVLTACRNAPTTSAGSTSRPSAHPTSPQSLPCRRRAGPGPPLLLSMISVPAPGRLAPPVTLTAVAPAHARTLHLQARNMLASGVAVPAQARRSCPCRQALILPSSQSACTSTILRAAASSRLARLVPVAPCSTT